MAGNAPGIAVQPIQDIMTGMNVQGRSYERHRERALAWLRDHSIPEQGVMVSSRRRVPYLEVTGYLIPTLLSAGCETAAYSYAQFLAYMERPDGGFAGPDGIEYLFDTGQALRGLLAASQRWPEFRAAAIRAGEYILSRMEPGGRIPAAYADGIPESVHVYILPALLAAGKAFGRDDFSEAALASCAFYCGQPGLLDTAVLTHFLGYVVDGLIDMGETELVVPVVEKIFAGQRRSGVIPAMLGSRWCCSVGAAQFACIGYKLGMRSQADRVVAYLCGVQEVSGGFRGSYGFGAAYFEKEEISWAVKFFLDALQLRSPAQVDIVAQPSELDPGKWHEAVCAPERVASVAGRLRANVYPAWIRPLLTVTSAGDSVLELGSGTGELSAILAMYGRKTMLLDYSRRTLEFSRQLFEQLSLPAEFLEGDVTRGLQLADGSIDWVFSSGLLEHFSDEQIVAILRESARVSVKGVLAMVPNANALFYRIGKCARETAGTWPYGFEEPRFSLREQFAAAGLVNVAEESVGVYHSLEFWGKKDPQIAAFLETVHPREMLKLNQGYLLVTYGHKS